MRKKLGNILLALMFVAGLCVLLYPSFSDWWNSRYQAEEVKHYVEAIDSMSIEQLEQARAEAEAYNQALAAKGGFSANLSEAQQAEYDHLLDIGNNGMMGYITIDKIGVELPVYHGVEEPVLQKFVGHLPGTSLPVGGESTHSVLSGHRGLPSSRLFTDLDKMELGDVFLVTTLGETMAYEVDDIRTVEPSGVSGLGVQSGKDLVTLVTCTPYAVNTHRLLVQGHRIPYESTATVAANAVLVDPMLVTLTVALVAAALLLAGFVMATRRGKSGRAPRAPAKAAARTAPVDGMPSTTAARTAVKGKHGRPVQERSAKRTIGRER